MRLGAAVLSPRRRPFVSREVAALFVSRVDVRATRNGSVTTLFILSPALAKNRGHATHRPCYPRSFGCGPVHARANFVMRGRRRPSRRALLANARGRERNEEENCSSGDKDSNGATVVRVICKYRSYTRISLHSGRACNLNTSSYLESRASIESVSRIYVPDKHPVAVVLRESLKMRLRSDENNARIKTVDSVRFALKEKRASTSAFAILRQYSQQSLPTSPSYRRISS